MVDFGQEVTFAKFRQRSIKGSVTAEPNDTFLNLSRRVYGTDTEEEALRAANPGVNEPIFVGTVIRTPDIGTDVADPIVDASEKNQVAITIGGKRYRYWSTVTIDRELDAVDSFEFTGPFDPERKGFASVFAPFSYDRVTIQVGNEKITTATILNNQTQVVPDERTITVNGYARAGVLFDCTAPPSLVTEWVDLNVFQIAEKLAKPFGLKVDREAIPNGSPATKSFDYIGIGAEDRIGTFLARLARQRGLVLGSNVAGDLVFRTDGLEDTPVATLTEGEMPVERVKCFFQPQRFYSHVTAMETSILGGIFGGGGQTVRSPDIDAFRPLNVIVTETEGDNLTTAANAEMGRMYANAMRWNLELPTWRTPGGELWRPGQVVSLLAPGVFINRRYNFVIRRVSLARSKLQEQARLDLILPGSLAGELPTESMPWESA